MPPIDVFVVLFDISQRQHGVCKGVAVLIEGRPDKGRVLFGHGAGAPMDSDFMDSVATRFVQAGFETVRYEFPYMQKRRSDGKKRPPDRVPILLEFLSELLATYNDGIPLYLAGKSMGGRISTMVLEHLEQPINIEACFVFGYPFHPIGKPERLRIEHFDSIQTPIHIFQGTRDAMGAFGEVSGYNLPANIHLHWLEDGNHDLKPRKASGLTQLEHLDAAFETIKEC